MIRRILCVLRGHRLKFCHQIQFDFHYDAHGNKWNTRCVHAVHRCVRCDEVVTLIYGGEVSHYHAAMAALAKTGISLGEV